MIRIIDNLLNRVTMYKLALFYLTVLFVVAVVFCFTGILPYSGWGLIVNFLVISLVSIGTNFFFSQALKVPINIESGAITSFILALIITPGASVAFLVIVSAIAQGSKYILNFRGRHIFNPAAIAVLIAFYTIQEGASWWIGGAYLLPLVLVGGLLLAKKIQRLTMVFTFLLITLVAFGVTNYGSNLGLIWQTTLVNSSLFFFAFVMFTEPLTTPPTHKMRLVYAALVGILYGTSFYMGPIFSTPELALAVGNIFSLIVSSKGRFRLKLKSKTEMASGIYDFVFESNRKLSFAPGQYMEWTIDPSGADMRGNRRFFTVASSPTEGLVHLGVRFYEPSSSFKKKLINMQPGEEIFAGQLAGDFTLPKNSNEKLVFIAGGIGITPFRSMLKFMIDKNEKRDAVLFYLNRIDSEIAYRDILRQSEQLGVKVINVLTEQMGFLNVEMIKQNVPDFADRTFYISGSHSMVTAFEDSLKSLGVPKNRIKIDFFPGYV